MSKLCPVCGSQCEATAVQCPVCGLPLPTGQPTVGSQSSHSGQPAAPSQTIQPAWTNQPQNPQPARPVQPQDFQTAQAEPPQKNSKKGLWIALGVTGGVLLLLILLAVLFLLVVYPLFRTSRSSQMPGSAWGTESTASFPSSDTSYQDYYYPDYE